MWAKFQVWVNENGIANLLSLSMLEKAGCKVSPHTDKNWVVFTHEGDEIAFKRDTGITEGMPYTDLRTTGKAGLALTETTANNMAGFTKEEVKKAKLSRIMQGRIGHQSTPYFKQILSQNRIKNCPISVTDVNNASVIYGPCKPGVKGWTIRKSPLSSRRMRLERVKIPRAWCEANKNNKNVTLTADVMFVAGVPFLITHSQIIKFGTVEFLPRQLAADLANSLEKALNLHARGGFN